MTAKVAASKTSGSLPERWKLGRRRAALSCLALVTIFSWLFHEEAGVDQLDNGWLRARFSLREALQGSKPDPNIVIAAIDDRCLDQWPEATVDWGGHLAAAVDELNRSGARAIGFDWLQGTAGSHDQELGTALSLTPKVVFVKFIRADGRYVLMTPALRDSPPNAYTDDADSITGLADIAAPDSIDTSFRPSMESQTGIDVAFAMRVAQRSALPLTEFLPIRPDGTLLINFESGTGSVGPNAPFRTVSLFDIASEHAPDPRFKDKIILIGETYKGNNDFHYTPFLTGLTGTRLINGVELQANAVATLLGDNAIAEPDDVLVWLLSMALGAAGVWGFATLSWGRAAVFALVIGASWALLSLSVFCSWHNALPVVVPLLSLILGIGSMGGYRALSEERERAQVMKVWGRHQDPRLIEQLLAHPEWRGGQGAEAIVTVLFADLKNFTKTVESLSPPAAIEALNRYLALLSGTILEHGGVVDKYLGDGLMAQWGAPNPRPDHATAAVAACLDIERRLRDLTPRLQKEGQVTFEVRLTLHTGPVVAGPLGSEDRLEYTIIGDTVNVTSRLQETAKQLDSDFLISETTRDACEGELHLGRETEVEIRGRVQPLRVFEVLHEPVLSQD